MAYICIFLIFKLILERGSGAHRERNIDSLFHLLVDSFMCPAQGSNPAALEYRDVALTNRAAQPRPRYGICIFNRAAFAVSHSEIMWYPRDQWGAFFVHPLVIHLDYYIYLELRFYIILLKSLHSL